MQPNKCYFIDPVINKNYKIPLMVVGQVVKIKCQDNEQRHKKSKVFAGNVIFINNRCVIIEGENYKESFALSQFKRGEVYLLNTK